MHDTLCYPYDEVHFYADKQFYAVIESFPRVFFNIPVKWNFRIYALWNMKYCVLNIFAIIDVKNHFIDYAILSRKSKWSTLWWVWEGKVGCTSCWMTRKRIAWCRARERTGWIFPQYISLIYMCYSSLDGRCALFFIYRLLLKCLRWWCWFSTYFSMLFSWLFFTFLFWR